MKFFKRVCPFHPVVLVLYIFLFSVPTAGAQNLPVERVLPVDMALTAAKGAMEQCKSDGFRVSVAVVDRSGVVRVLLRNDGATQHTPDSSFKKAYTASSLRQPTMNLAKLIVKMPAIQDLARMNENILLLGGGLPIQFAGDTVGGIGVGGAPGAHLDEACALAGLKAIGANTEFSKKE